MSKNLKKILGFGKSLKLFYFLNGIIDYGSLCIDYESLLKTVGQLLLIRSIYRIRFELKAHKGSGCPQNSKAERESEFWFGQNSDGNSWRIPLTQKSWKNYPRKPSGIPEKKGYGLALLKTWWVFCSHTMESTVRARNIFYANRSIFYSNRKLFFRPP